MGIRCWGQGELLSLLFFPREGALPVIVSVPEMGVKEDFVLAYSCMPAALTAIAQIKSRKVPHHGEASLHCALSPLALTTEGA